MSNNSKYNVFKDYLKNSNKDMIILTFNEIENILGFKLAKSFRNYTSGWYGTSVNDVIAFKKSWHRAGYTVSKVDLKKEEVIFIKFNNPNEYKKYL